MKQYDYQSAKFASEQNKVLQKLLGLTDEQVWDLRSTWCGYARRIFEKPLTARKKYELFLMMDDVTDFIPWRFWDDLVKDYKQRTTPPPNQLTLF